MNEQNKHAALTIAQQYPPAQYNLLVPMQTVTEIADIQKPVMNSVKISTDLNDGEIYEMEKAKGVQAYCDALEAIQKRYSSLKIMAITHDPEMKARFPQAVDVVKTAEGSKVIYS